MTNSLEDKIKLYLKNNGATSGLLDMQYNNLANDIAEIAEKEYRIPEVNGLAKDPQGIPSYGYTVEKIEELQTRIETYKKILSRWDKVAKLFDDEVKYGESWTDKTYDLVKKLKDDYEMLIKRYDLLDDDWVQLKKEKLKLEKENADLKANLEMAKSWHSGEVDRCDKLLKENADLKAKLDNVKYLERDSVSTILNKHIPFGKKGLPEAVTMGTVWDIEEDILSLALPVIDKERIIKIFKEHYTKNNWNEVNPNEYHITEDKFETIADEILNNKE